MTWFLSHAPVLAMAFAASTILLIIVTVLAAVRVAAWRDSDRRNALALRGAQSELAIARAERRLDGEALARAKDWQHSAAESLAVTAESVRAAGATELAINLSIAQGALRRSGTLLEQVSGERSDVPGIEVEELVAAMREQGLRIELSERGERRALRSGIAAAAVTVVRESLQNALQHGEASGLVLVSLTWGVSSLTVDVRNGSWAAPEQAARMYALDERDPSGVATPGYGMALMWDAVERHGGLLMARHLRDDGFAVTGTFPAAFEYGSAQAALPELDALVTPLLERVPDAEVMALRAEGGRS